MYDVEIDQSGRTDVLTVDTALALSDGVQRAILIPRFVKRECHALLRARGMRKALIGIRLFSAFGQLEKSRLLTNWRGGR